MPVKQPLKRQKERENYEKKSASKKNQPDLDPYTPAVRVFRSGSPVWGCRKSKTGSGKKLQ